MKTATLFCLISLVALPAWAAAPINFKNIASTNVVKTNDLLLIDSDLGGGSYATRAIPIALLPSGGDTIWTNSAGVIVGIYPNGTNGIYSGNSYDDFSYQFTPGPSAFQVGTVSFAELPGGMPDWAYANGAVYSTNSAIMSEIEARGTTTGGTNIFTQFQVNAYGPTNNSSFHVDVYADHDVYGSYSQLRIESGSGPEISLKSSGAPTAPPISVGSLFTVPADGSITTGGNTNRWIFGGVTNGAPDVSVDGAHYPLAVTDSPALTGTPTINGQSVETQLTNKVAKAGDTMSGTLGFSGTSTLLNLPSLTTAQKNAATAQAGSLAYDSDLGRVQAYDGAAWHSRVRLDGDTMTGPLRGPDGSLSNPTFSFGSSTNTGFFINSGLLEVAVGGALKMYWDANYINCSKPLNFSSDTIIGRGGLAYQFQLGNPSGSAAPNTYTFTGEVGTGTDKVGGGIVMQPGRSTGTAASGSFDIMTGLSGESSSSTANTYLTRYHAKPKFVALTHATPTAIETFSLAANKVIGGSLNVLVYATNSTPHLQAVTSDLVFQAIAIGTTITGTVDIEKAGSQAADSGTLTITGWTVVDNGNNTFSIAANVSSDLASPVERAMVIVTALHGTASITITDP